MIGIEIDDLERSVPGLVANSDLPPKEAPLTTASDTTATEDEIFSYLPFGSATPSSLSTLTDFTEHDHRISISSQSSVYDLPTPSSMSTLTEFTEHSRPSTPSTLSTLTDFSTLDHASSISSLSTPPSRITYPAPTATPSRQDFQSPQKHRSMITMSDGSEWLPPTLERIQAYISSQGTRTLCRSIRRLVVGKAKQGSKVALRYENDIMRVDLKIIKDGIAGRRTERKRAEMVIWLLGLGRA